MSAAPAPDELERLQARLNALEQERKHLLAVIEILQEISGSLHFADIVQSVALRLGETFGLDRCSIFLAERGGRRVRLVASYEDPGIRNYVVDLARYPELRRAIQTGETVFIADAASDPSLSPARGALTARRVKSITAIPIAGGARRSAPSCCAPSATAPPSPPPTSSSARWSPISPPRRSATRTDSRSSASSGARTTALRRREREQAALIGFLRNLLSSYPPRAASDDEPGLASEMSPEIGRLSGVAQAVLSQEAASR